MHFSKFNREGHMMALFMAGRTSMWADNERCQLTPKEKKYLKTATTYVKKANEEIVKRLGPDYGKRILRDIETSEITIHFRSGEKDTIAVSVEDAENLAEYALYVCQRTKACPEDFKDCRLRKTMLDLNIPLTHLEDTDGCEYRLDLEELK